jgi:hypothetical protein
MATKLDRTIVREVELNGETFTIAVSPDGIRMSKKRFRSGVTVSWKTIWNEGSRREEEQVRPRLG